MYKLENYGQTMKLAKHMLNVY